jgi:hypothetical protein
MAERTRLTGGRCLCLAGAETWTAPVFLTAAGPC